MNLRLDRRRLKICVVSLPYLAQRTWIRQDVQILETAGFHVMMLSVPEELPGPRSLIWLLRHLRFVLNCHVLFGWFAFPVVALIGKAFGKVTVLNAVGYEVAYYPEFGYGLPLKRYPRALVAIGLRNADYVIAISKESAKWAETWGAQKVNIIYEGIDINRFRTRVGRPRSPPGAPTLVTVAYLGLMNVVRKDLFTLFEALKLVRKVLPNAKLIIVGEKMDGYPLLIKAAKEMGILDAIAFKGFVDFEQLLDILSNASLYVMPSLQEGFPTALCEALACGVPIVTTNRPAMNEIFENNKHALLVEARNPQKLAEAIIKALIDRNLAETIANNGRKLVELMYSREIRAANLQSYFLSIVKEIAKRGRDGGPNLMWLCVVLGLCTVSPLIALVIKIFSSITSSEE